MLFSSIIFIFLFLPIFLGIYFIIKKEYRNLFVLVSSLLFYFWGEGWYIFVIIAYMIANYIFGICIERFTLRDTLAGRSAAKVVLVTGLIFNIGLLVFFKYFNFIVANTNFVLGKLSHFQFSNPDVHLPIGISFFTFQAISYIVDVYRRDVAAQKNFINFSMYKTLFPQLIAGPIVRYKDISKQVTDRTVTYDSFSIGIQRFVIGLAKKVLIANVVGTLADSLFAAPASELSFGIAWLGVICYSIQIFFDFSGYSDMAIGLGKMIGFDFLENFDYPYISKSIREFWRRWHISLSSWFRDYLYIPLGGNRMGTARNYANLFFVFLLCGLWHGASWLFVIWGCWYGLFLVLERAFLGKLLEDIHPFFQHIYALLVIMVGWVFFRADTFPHALVILQNMFGLNGISLTGTFDLVNMKVLVAIIFGIILSTPLLDKAKYVLSKKSLFSQPIFLKIVSESYRVSILLLFILCAVVISSSTYNPFIYFRF